MNYIKELNALYDRIEIVPLSGSATALWHALMHINNKTRWQKQFTASAAVLCLKAGLKESSFKRARKELKEKGYIDYQSRDHNQAPIYQMISLTYDDYDVDEEQEADRDVADRADHLDNHYSNESMNQSENQGSVTLIKRNKKKENEINNISDAFVFYQENFGVVSPFVADSLVDWVREVGEELVLEAMKRALERNRTNWGYVKSILQSWGKKGLHTLEDVRAEEVAFRNQRGKKRSSGVNGENGRKEIVPDWFVELKQKEKQQSQAPHTDPEEAAAMKEKIEGLREEIKGRNDG
ncbi:DnaD domain protein [Oceanobacillus salinisoli]|uniref:DnaD domain protein n=1 Tax=Oceanobacillus salinisoli TaxID=2678611 RepID=UPI0012E30E55|nr:DnaD domain protein [Oceanobacillus salinisoli]